MNSEREITDSEVHFLASLAGSLKGEFLGEKEVKLWQGSPFYWIKSRPSRQIGSIGEALVAGWSAARGFDVQKPTNSGHDRRIGGRKIEIKFSTLWTNDEIFRFQQLRDQDYEYAFLLGLSPFDAQAWFVPKEELSYNRPPELVHQHGGASGRDTRWLSFSAASPPHWLEPFGGTLSRVRNLIQDVAV